MLLLVGDVVVVADVVVADDVDIVDIFVNFVVVFYVDDDHVDVDIDDVLDVSSALGVHYSRRRPD